MKEYKGVDIGRVVFACLIPLLHIPFQENIGIDIVRQYISRLGVPFFFAVSGMFLYQSIEKRGAPEALKHYLIRIGRVLLIWLAIYSPLLIMSSQSYGKLIQEIIFKTPSFLWFLSSLVVASIPFCLIHNRRVLACCAVLLYVIGTSFSDSYIYNCENLCDMYRKIFLTTRNGFFFALPLMIAGELTWKAHKSNMPLLIVSWLFLIAEITFVGIYTDKTVDRSMYYYLPVFIYALLLSLRDWNPNIDRKHLGGISSAIYVMQYGIITIGTIVFRKMNLSGTNTLWFVYLAVITIPSTLYLILRKQKIVRIIF